ncbi:MAG: DUF6777 domain-containing protein [Ilumatobacteraceae bacterium]
MNKRTIVGVILVLLMGAGAFFVAMLVSDDPAPTEASGTFLSRVGAVGPDAFSPSYAVEQYTGDVADADGATTTDDPNLYVGRPPTYGGTGKNACDIEGMIEFFSLNPERAREWARTQGIALKELRPFLESLRPVFLKKNVKLTMFGFAAGRAYGYTAIIEAGTAVLIDEKGMPRVRCACGNPLIASSDPEKTTKKENTRLVESGAMPDTPAVDSTTTTVTETPGTDSPPTTITTQEACPEPVTPGTGTRVYVDDWAWVYDGEKWVKVGSTESVTSVDDIPGYVERERASQGDSAADPCNPCPPASVYKYGDVLTDSNGDYWRYDYNGYYPIETSRNPVYSILDIPGYGDDCLPCPPSSYPDYNNAAWVDANGVRWTAQYVPDAAAVRWVNEAGDIRTAAELRATTPECAPCPQDALLQVGDRIIDDNGKVWTKEANGFRSFDGEFAESITLIPGYAGDCVPCPPTGGGTYELTYIDRYGTVWTQSYDPGEGSVWTNGEGDRRSSTELFASNPECNPCPPNGTYGEGTEIVANDWVWVYEQGRWWQRGTGYSVSNIDDIEGYSDPCNPCPPERIYNLGDYLVDEFGATYTSTIYGYKRGIDEMPLPSLDQISGYRDDCVPCIPESYRGIGTTFVDGNGKRWTSTYDTTTLTSVVIVWVSEDGERKSTRELNAMNPECNPCPNPAEVVTGSIYVAPNGGVWRFDGSMWVSKENGDRVSLVSDLPNYTQNCDPCPPTDDNTRDATGAPARSTAASLVHGFATIEQAGTPVVDEPAETDITTWERTDDDCAPPCPPDQLEKGAEYIDDAGDTWVFEPGDDIWRNARTNETRITADLPNYTGRCNPCPPLTDTPVENDMRLDANGQWWRFQEGRWVNQSSGESRTLISDIPGYTEGGCDLPPCADPGTLQAGDVVIDGNGVRWVVAENGEERISTNGDVATLNEPLDGCNPCPPARSYLSDNNEEIITDRDECNPCPDTAVFTEMTGPDGQLVLVPIFGESRPCGDPCVPPTNLRAGDVIRVADRLWVYTTLGWRNDENGVTTWAQTVADIPGWLSLCNAPETVLSRSTSAPSDDDGVIQITPTSNPQVSPPTTTGNVITIDTTTTTVVAAPTPTPTIAATSTTVAPAEAPATTEAVSSTSTTAPAPAANVKPTITKVSCSGYTSTTMQTTKFTLVLEIKDSDGSIAKFSLQGTTQSGYTNYKPTSINGSNYTYVITKNTANQFGTGVIASATDNQGATAGFLFSANNSTCP